MKVIKFLVVVAVISTVLSSCDNQKVTKKALNSQLDTVSYALGLDIASKLKVNFAEVDKELFIQGVVSGIDSTDILLDKEKINGILSDFFQKRQAENRKKQQEEAAKKAEVEFADVKAEGIKFLEENKSKPGVQVTASGLQYIVMKEGKGEKPTEASKVKVHYHGTLIDGTVFESTVEKNQPAEFFMNQVMKGWIEGLQLMNVGSKYKFFIPQDLAYGAFPRPNGPIKPFMALVFEVELLEIVK